MSPIQAIIRSCFVLVLALPSHYLPGQTSDNVYNMFGNPFVRNYSPKDYDGHAQTWQFAQDPLTGILYVGSSEGILQYDGNNWNKIRLPNRSIVRTIAFSADGKLYCGGSGEIGYLVPDPSGIMQYVSLTPLLDKNDRQTSDIWKVAIAEGNVFYQTHSELLVYTPESNSFQVIRTDSRFHHMFKIGNEMWLTEAGKGFVKYENGALLPVKVELEGTFDELLEWSADSVYLFTDRGMFLWSDGILSKMTGKLNRSILENPIRKVLRTRGDQILLAVGTSGIYQIDRNGNILSQITKEDGLQDLNIHSIFEDRQGMIWVSSNFGISRISWDIPIRKFDERNGLIDTVNDIIRFDGRLYVSTHTGLFMQDPEDPNKFTQIAKIGEAFALEIIEDQLWVSTVNGIFKIHESGLITKICSDYSYKFQQSVKDPDKVLIGTTQGLIVYDLGKDNFMSTKDLVPNNILYMNQDSLGNLWVGSADNQLFRVDYFNEGSLETPVVNHYFHENGLPNSHIQVNRIGNELIFSSEFGIYEEFQKGVFGESTRFPSLPTIVYFIYQASDRTVYVLYGEPPFMKIMALKNENGTFLRQVYPELLTVESPGIWVAFEDHDKSLWFGMTDGILNFKPNQYDLVSSQFLTNISSIKLNGDSVLAQNINTSFQLPPYTFGIANNSIRFEYSLISFESESENRFSYKLEGLDREWSGWSTENIREYVGLREGAYRFRVKSKNLFGQIGSESSFSFTITPPWFRSWWFVGFVVAAGLAILALVVRFFSTRKLIRRVEELELQQKVQTERERISRDLHDSVGTHFAYIISKLDYLYLGWTRDHIKDKKDYLGNISDFARSGMRMLRETIWALNQSEVETNSLRIKIADYLRLCFEHESCEYDFQFNTEINSVNSTIALNCFRIIQETVSNSLKYARAKKFTILFEIKANALFSLELRDNGIGFDIMKVSQSEGENYGLKNMKSRANEMGAVIQFNSDDEGTRITVIKNSP